MTSLVLLVAVELLGRGSCGSMAGPTQQSSHTPAATPPRLACVPHDEALAAAPLPDEA